MASVRKEIGIDAPASVCWDALRDFGGLHERLAKGFVTAAVMVDETDREVTFANGAVARERLVGIDEASMRLAYTVVEIKQGVHTPATGRRRSKSSPVDGRGGFAAESARRQ